MKRTFNLLVIVALLALTFGAFGTTPALAAATTVTSSSYGEYRGDGSYASDYIVGYSSWGGINNYFVFDLSGLGGNVNSATLRIYNPSNGFSGTTETVDFYDVSTPISTLTGGTGGVSAYNDLGSGTLFGSVTVTSSSNDTWVEIPLNVDGISAINSAVGGNFAIGGYLSTDAGNDYVFGYSYMSGQPAQLVVDLTAGDTTPPIVTVPADKTVEATSAFGAIVDFAAEVSAMDETSPANPVVTCVPASGSTFALGTTNVDCSATDDAGNTGHGYFNVTVQDTTDPVVTVPADKTVEATSASGAVVDFAAEVSATDAISPANPAVSCTPASGSTFVLGTTNVDCSATDTAGNIGHGYFDVTVEDTTDPVLSLPADIIAYTLSPAGTVVDFIASATDLVDASPTVVCNPPSGSTFPLGTTPVNCSATDDAGNVANGSFSVTVIQHTVLSATFTSSPNYDGYMLEPSENANTGFLAPAATSNSMVGDHSLDRQVRSLLHFNTASLPDNAVITGITVKVKRQLLFGNPFSLGNLQVDIASPFFGPEIGLKPADFQAVPSAANVGFFDPTPATGNWYSAVLEPAAFPFLSLTGSTQFRLAFSLDDNDNGRADWFMYYSGNFRTVSYQPVLIVSYYIP